MSKSSERVASTLSGWTALLGLLLMAAVCFFLIYGTIHQVDGNAQIGSIPRFIGSVLLTLFGVFLAIGFFTLQPNQSAVLLLFGSYHGTAKDTGLRWANPLLTKKKVSLRAHNLNGDKLKVNDKVGNPVEIAVVVVWRPFCVSPLTD